MAAVITEQEATDLMRQVDGEVLKGRIVRARQLLIIHSRKMDQAVVFRMHAGQYLKVLNDILGRKGNKL